MGNSYDGIILIDKGEGETSFEVVKNVRRILKIKKAGHAGTLDPFATGLLVVLLNQGTKLSPYIMSGEKKYRATIRLGIETETGDPTGCVTRTMSVPELQREYIKEKSQGFIGEIEQVPPIFSAVRHKGKRAYELARKGIKIDLEKRRVKIRCLEIISVDLPDVTIEVQCSSGTYMRSLAVDLGKQIGPGAHLKTLRRISSGSFTAEDAFNVKRAGIGLQRDILLDKIIPLREALPHMKETNVDNGMAKKIRNGYQPEWEEVVTRADLPVFEGHMKLVNEMELVAITKAHQLPDHNKRRLKILRVFN